MSTTVAERTHSRSKDLTTRSAKAKYAHIAKVYRLAAEGLNQQQIAAVIGCNQSTVSRILAELKQTPEEVRAVSRALLPTVIDSAVAACEPAAKRGDVTPHKFIAGLAHQELGAQAGNAAGMGGVTIHIGAPGAPIRLPDIQISPEPTSFSPSISLCKSTLSVDSDDDSVA